MLHPSQLRRKIYAGISCFLLLGGLSTGCSDNPVGDASGGVLSINISNGGQQLASPSFAGAAWSVTVTSAKISIGRIRFKSVDGVDSLDFRSDVATVVNLDINGAEQSLGSMAIPTGVYDETRFRIERLDSADGSDWINHPDMRDLSISVEGFVNGSVDSAYVWTATFSEDQIHQFAPFTINDGDTVNLVFEFDMTNWFSDGAGGKLDPREALTTGNVQSDIESNIKAAFKVVRR